MSCKLLRRIRHPEVKEQTLKSVCSSVRAGQTQDVFFEGVPKKEYYGLFYLSGKAETEEVSADFWLLLFRDKSDPRRGAEYPL